MADKETYMIRMQGDQGLRNDDGKRNIFIVMETLIIYGIVQN